MAAWSNHLMAITVLAYLAAMVCYAAEYAFGNRSHVGRAAARPARQLVGAGAPIDDTPPPPPASVPEGPARRDLGVTLGLIAVGFNWVGLAVHLSALVTRGLAAHRMPWGN